MSKKKPPASENQQPETKQPEPPFPIPPGSKFFHISPEDNEYDFIWRGPHGLKAHYDLRTCQPEIRFVAGSVARAEWLDLENQARTNPGEDTEEWLKRKQYKDNARAGAAWARGETG